MVEKKAKDEKFVESRAINVVFGMPKKFDAPVAVIMYKKRSWHWIDGCTSSYSTGGQFRLHICQ